MLLYDQVLPPPGSGPAPRHGCTVRPGPRLRLPARVRAEVCAAHGRRPRRPHRPCSTPPQHISATRATRATRGLCALTKADALHGRCKSCRSGTTTCRRCRCWWPSASRPRHGSTTTPPTSSRYCPPPPLPPSARPLTLPIPLSRFFALPPASLHTPPAAPHPCTCARSGATGMLLLPRPSAPPPPSLHRRRTDAPSPSRRVYSRGLGYVTAGRSTQVRHATTGDGIRVRRHACTCARSDGTRIRRHAYARPDTQGS
jgi:hypothetical protein